MMEAEEEEEVVEMNGLSGYEGRDGRDRRDWGDEMLEKRVFERWRWRWIWRWGWVKEEDDEGENIKGWMRETNEEKEEWEMEKEAGIGEWGSGRRLFGVEKREKERMAGWWVVREKFVRAREAWAERKSGDLVAGWTWQVEEQMVAAEWRWAVRSGQPVRETMVRRLTHNELLMIEIH
eukprot:MONOS_12156.1-p1 / transcript=MONOS_12156.1 / gene=MONOS_12156 / organism=Monocercomonoides_exilis_PA203 / gene_product=unspecified product / transcript_product=unspecified product / location=Mono_scaffold00654:11-588(-) / protein_length=177 / sequence_SO=supercontig / SO=protein_coding / is_pseudo=false